MHTCEKKKEIYVPIPLTSHTGKIRIKSRNTFCEYGKPHASKQKKFTKDDYVEWQISYALSDKDKQKMPYTLIDKLFEAHNGEKKFCMSYLNICIIFIYGSRKR